ncbi:MAG: DNA-directed RNA polymerase subunit L [archaeon]|nr:DNA-directed RNA polymerase subunit L [archaeon]
MAMRLELIEKNEKMIKIGVKDTDTTLITPIVEELNSNKKVKIVRYIETHPELDVPALYVEMREGDPVMAVKDAAMNVSNYFATQ